MKTPYQAKNYLQNFIYNDIQFVRKIEHWMNLKTILILSGYLLFTNFIILDIYDVLWASILLFCISLLLIYCTWKSISIYKHNPCLRMLVKSYYVRSVLGIFAILYSVIVIVLLSTQKIRNTNDSKWILLLLVVTLITILTSLYTHRKYMKIKETKITQFQSFLSSIIIFLILRYIITTIISVIIICIFILILVIYSLCEQIVRAQRLLQSSLESLQEIQDEA